MIETILLHIKDAWVFQQLSEFVSVFCHFIFFFCFNLRFGLILSLIRWIFDSWFHSEDFTHHQIGHAHLLVRNLPHITIKPSDNILYDFSKNLNLNNGPFQQPFEYLLCILINDLWNTYIIYFLFFAILINFLIVLL